MASGPLSPSDPVRVTGADDPVGLVIDAHAHGRPIALSTSGTSGMSQSVVRTTESWWSSFPAYGELTGVAAGADVWVPGPLDATMNLLAAVHALVVGATVVDRPEAATHACLTPTALDSGLAELRPGTRVTVAGATLPRPLAERAAARGLETSHYYGAAELSFVAAGPDAESLTAFPGAEIEIRAGEIWVRSPYLADGYDGQMAPLRTHDGWATVGDVGRLDGERLVVTGRPDAVQTAGATVVLAEVERVLAARATAPLACFGVNRPSVGQVLAVAVTDPADVARLKAAAREHLAPGHRPRLWFFIDVLPLTAAGKVDRAALTSLG
ncbi:MAG: o-succinylbenzoate--CoA ligase [Marmoricola sp.]